jgi:hypothetical protein
MGERLLDWVLGVSSALSMPPMPIQATLTTRVKVSMAGHPSSGHKRCKKKPNGHPTRWTIEVISANLQITPLDCCWQLLSMQRTPTANLLILGHPGGGTTLPTHLTAARWGS